MNDSAQERPVPEWMSLPRHERPFRRRVIGLLAFVYDGLHHVKARNIRWFNEYGPGFEFAELSVRGGLDTYDGSTLTRLVIAAHELAIRVEVRASGPGMVKLFMSSRRRDGDSLMNRHPTLEAHVALLLEKRGMWLDEERGS